MGLKEHRAWCHAIEQISAIKDIISGVEHAQQASHTRQLLRKQKKYYFDEDKDAYETMLYRSVENLDDDNRSWLINILSQRVKDIDYRKL